jgi:hypothetical protein
MSLKVTKEQFSMIEKWAKECESKESDIVLQKVYNWILGDGSKTPVNEIAYILHSLAIAEKVMSGLEKGSEQEQVSP